MPCTARTLMNGQLVLIFQWLVNKNVSQQNVHTLVKPLIYKGFLTFLKINVRTGYIFYFYF